MRPTRTIAAVLGAAVALSGVPALAQAPGAQPPRPQLPAAAPADAQIEAVVRRWIEAHPEVILESVNRFVLKEKEKEAQAKNERTAQFVSEMSDARNQPFVGNPEGKTTLVYVLDGACGYCKLMTKTLDDLVSRNPDLKVVHRWVAFLGPSSEYAMRVAYLVGKRHPAQYQEFYHELMGQKGQLSNDVVDKVLAGAVGEGPALQLRSEVSTGASRGEVDDYVKANNELAHRSGIEGTPTYMAAGLGPDGVLRGAQQPDAMARLLDKARASAAARN